MIPLPHPGPSIGHVPNAQRHDPGSLLQFVQKLIRRYRASAEIGWGELSILKQPHAGVLAHRVTGPLGSMITLHNFTAETMTVPLTSTVPTAIPGWSTCSTRRSA